MTKKLSYEEKVKRDVLKDVKRLRIPSRTNRPFPVARICTICKRNKVTDHHFLCNSCHRTKQIKEKAKNGKHNNKR